MSLLTLFEGSVASRVPVAAPAQRAAASEETLVDGSRVAKGQRVRLSKAFASEIHELGKAHPQHQLLEQEEGTVTAIGVDRSACMVLFGQHTYKLLIGRGGAFHLKLSDMGNARAAGPRADTQAVDPRLGLLGIEWQQVRDGRCAVKALTPGMAASKCGKIETGDILVLVDDVSAAATVAQVEARLKSVLCAKPSVVLQLRRSGLFGDSVFSVSITLDEWIMDGSSVDKGLGARLSKEYCACVAAAGDSHQHYKIYTLNATGVVTAIGLDKQACIVDFPGVGSLKMLIGRQGEDGRRCYMLVHRAPLPGCESAVVRVASSVVPPSLPSTQMVHQSGVEDRVVVGRSLRKGTLVCLSKSYQEHLHGLNAANALERSVLLGAKCVGVVTAIGEDKEACIVDWGTLGTHKMLVGRNGSFQLSEPSAEPPAVSATQPGSHRHSNAIASAPRGDTKADGGGHGGGNDIGKVGDSEDGGKTWQEEITMKLFSNLLSPSGAAREANSSRQQQSEKLVIGRELVKGAQVEFSDDYAAIISMAGDSHAHYHLLGCVAVVTAIGLDQEACHVSFGEENAQPHKFLVGRRGQHQLAYARTHDGVQTAAIAEFDQPCVCPSRSSAQELDPDSDNHVPTGLGIMVAQREGHVVIESLAKGSAAAAVEPFLRRGDRILSCEGKPVTTIADFEKLARGKVGSSKRLQVSRLRGRADAAAQGSKGGLMHGNSSGEKQLVFMMSLVVGIPNAHTLCGQIRDAESSAKQGADADSGTPDHAIIASRAAIADLPRTVAGPHTPETDGATKFRSLPSPPAPPIKKTHSVVQPWIPELSSPPQLHIQPAFATPTSRDANQNMRPLIRCTEVESSKPMCSADSALSADNKQVIAADKALSADIDFARLDIIEPPVGMGSFKTVYKALLDGSSPVAALSVCKQSARSALAEVQILQRVKTHPNLPVLFGVSCDTSGGIWLVQEYFPLGGLDVQLEVWDDMLSLASRLCILQQICEAMLFLRLQGVMHRDLSTRNILVHSLHADQVLEVWVKVSDFGLSCVADSSIESVSVRRDSEDLAIPWRWTAPEVFFQDCWYWKSDVWSFGVTMWEVFSCAEVPYVELSDEEVQEAVLSQGQRLQAPVLCPAGVYGLMQACWQAEPKARPSWTEIGVLLQLLSDDPAPSRILI